MTIIMYFCIVRNLYVLLLLMGHSMSNHREIVVHLSDFSVVAYTHESIMCSELAVNYESALSSANNPSSYPCQVQCVTMPFHKLPTNGM